mmetsp:Transcript_14176/g.21638  ORF Transcript_14176/g.21638 Transcript_14176/m.21638 type:complete len:130 (-) Transcript_14176:126-515(-)
MLRKADAGRILNPDPPRDTEDCPDEALVLDEFLLPESLLFGSDEGVELKFSGISVIVRLAKGLNNNSGSSLRFDTAIDDLILVGFQFLIVHVMSTKSSNDGFETVSDRRTRHWTETSLAASDPEGCIIL